jgi:hypothetical protein
MNEQALLAAPAATSDHDLPDRARRIEHTA